MAGTDHSLKTPAIQVQTQLVALPPGLYLFRYASQLPPDRQIPATITAAPAGNGIVDFFPGEGTSRNTLRKLGDCLVVRVLRAEGAVLIAKYRIAGVTSEENAEIQIDRIDTTGQFVREGARTEAFPAPNANNLPGRNQRDASRASNAPASPDLAPGAAFSPASSPDASPATEGAALELLGHIQNRGDVRTRGWLGDPNGSARLEGFAIDWPQRPADVELLYTCEIQGQGQTPPVSSGRFCGTRQKGAPILSLSMILNGPTAKDYALAGQVVFQGCAPIALTTGQKLAGPRGHEPLVAMQVRIVHRQGAATPPRYPSPWDDPSVTRIFRPNADSS